ncbi:MAG: hypothetical protein SGJ27_09390 [Candidatus Melainabacteria bacterium]|nr:hypothetical protein [Candidatus Melainabacteria bacterium]
MKRSSIYLALMMSLQVPCAFATEAETIEASKDDKAPASKTVVHNVDERPLDIDWFSVEPSTITVNWDVDAFLSGKSDTLSGYDARQSRRNSTIAR